MLRRVQPRGVLCGHRVGCECVVMVDLLGSVGERVDRDSPAKFHKFNIVSMGSRTNLGDFVLWFAFGRS